MAPIVADGFWSIRSINDVVGLSGLVLGLASIWASWWLARRDLSKKIDEAGRQSREAVRRVASALSHAAVTDAVRCFREARAAIRTRDWARAVLRLEDGQGHLLQVGTSRQLGPVEREQAVRQVDNIRTAIGLISPMTRPNAKPVLPAAKFAQVMELIGEIVLLLERLDALLRVRPLEDFDDPRAPAGQADGTPPPPVGPNPGG